MNLVPGQVEKMLLDTGAVYVDGVLLAPCEGDNVFTVEREYRDISYNESPGKTKGLKRIIRENATLTVRPKGLTQAMLKMALPGSDIGVSDEIESGGRRVIADSEYADEIVFVGTMMDGTTKVITLYRGLADNGLTITAGDDAESIVELVFAAHYNPEDLTEPLYKIEDGEADGTSEVTFTITTSGTGDEDLATVKFAGRTKNPSSGDAVFSGVSYGTNRPYEIHLSGHESVYGSVTVDGATESVAVELQEL